MKQKNLRLMEDFKLLNEELNVYVKLLEEKEKLCNLKELSILAFFTKRNPRTYFLKQWRLKLDKILAEDEILKFKKMLNTVIEFYTYIVSFNEELDIDEILNEVKIKSLEYNNIIEKTEAILKDRQSRIKFLKEKYPYVTSEDFIKKSVTKLLDNAEERMQNNEKTNIDILELVEISELYYYLSGSIIF